MFTLHERTRRTLCRAGFLLLCIVPTCTVVGWIAFARSSLHAGMHERELSGKLGVTVSLAAAQCPSPRTTLLKDVVLTDEESSCELLRSRLVEIEQSSGETRIRVSQPKVVGPGSKGVWDLLERQMRSRTLQRRATKIVGDVTLDLPHAELTLTGVQADLLPGADRCEAFIQFRIAGYAQQEPVRVRLTRHRLPQPEPVAIEIETGSTAVPTEILAVFCPALSELGKTATFKGSIRAHGSPAGWTGTVRGVLNGLDLDALITQHFPHKLGGMAAVQITRATFTEGRLSSAEAIITAGPGLVSSSLLSAAGAALSCGANAEPRPAADPLHYEKLAVHVTIDDRGLSLRASPDADGALLADASLLLRQPAAEYQPVVNLVRALVPNSDVLVPATRQTEQLIRILPIPSIALSQQAGPTEPRLRLGRRPQ